jgi:hypothetical protein
LFASPPSTLFIARGQICAFEVISNVVPPMLKYRLFIASNCASVTVKRPVVESSTAPVSCWYFLNASVAIRSKVVPVSTMPELLRRVEELPVPYERVWSIPQ